MPRKHLAGAAVAAILVAAVLVLYPRKHAPEPPPVYGTVPDFSLTDQTGAKLSSADLRGRVWAASFIFTRCTTVCPVLVEKVKRVQDVTRDLRLVSFSVDPDYDTPAVLTAYARAHGADPARWSFLTGGDPAPIANAMKIGLDRVPGKAAGESIIHGSHIVLIDGQMQIRGYFDSSDETALERLVTVSKALND